MRSVEWWPDLRDSWLAKFSEPEPGLYLSGPEWVSYVVKRIDWKSDNHKYFLDIVMGLMNSETQRLLRIFMSGDKWKPLHGTITVLGIKKADRPEVSLRLKNMLYHLVEGRLPDVDHWAKYIMSAFDGEKEGNGQAFADELAGQIRNIERLSSDGIQICFSWRTLIGLLTMPCRHMFSYQG